MGHNPIVGHVKVERLSVPMAVPPAFQDQMRVVYTPYGHGHAAFSGRGGRACEKETPMG